MPSSSKELKNIPISISLLHEQEYINLCLILMPKKGNVKRRRAFSDKSSDKTDSDEKLQIKFNIFNEALTLEFQEKEDYEMIKRQESHIPGNC